VAEEGFSGTDISMSLLLLFFCGALMLAGLGLVYTHHMFMALIPLALMLLLVALTGLFVMAEIGMVAVLGASWRWVDQHPAKKGADDKKDVAKPVSGNHA
jgi:membrane protein implicated in regulation of membrane protease activity